MLDKPKIVKGCKITKGNTVYNNITHFSVYGDEVYFSNCENDSTSINVECKLKDVYIQFGDDK